jgi:CRISPR system Cascade subunit CasB
VSQAWVSEGRRGIAPVLDTFVDTKVAALQRDVLDDRSSAVAMMARLRRSASSETRFSAAWDDVLRGMPTELMGHGDDPSATERAAFHALALYARHQQSRARAMHQQGVGLGQGVHRLAVSLADEDAVLRRFHALGTAESFAEVVHHLRGLIGQLRAADIGLDYGSLARDLLDLQDPRRRGKVRLRWSRDYYRSRAKTESDSSSGRGDGPPRTEQAAHPSHEIGD